jgi:tryptophan-rich sensory protein
MVKKLLKKIVLLVFALGICLLAGYAGSLYTAPSIPTWYESLNKPDFQPPSWLFAPVWTALYILMGLSLYLLLQNGIPNKEVLFGLIFFISQLAFNVGWSYVFFGLHSSLFGLMCILALWCLILCTMIQTFRVTVVGGALLIPYLVWVTYATILNYYIMVMNPVSYILF